jgi:UDP-N-acetylmuramoyl-L-alanyl-D-glutamate--2,6-diaminopimelate ligase
MKIMELLDSLNIIKIQGDTDRIVKSIYYDSRRVTSQSLFVAISGYKSDGHRYIKDAVEKGAVAVVRDRDVSVNQYGESVADILVDDSRKALALLASKFYGYPSRGLGLIGITGTNGKTTVSYLIDSLLRCAGFHVGVIGTIAYSYRNRVLPSSQTTPESADLQQMLRDMVDNHTDYCVLEVSSHSLALKRVVGCDFQTAVFTNLGRDHLDFHKNQEAYFESKAGLFKDYPIKTAVINVDDPFSQRLLEDCQGKVFTYGIKESADIRAEKIVCSEKGSFFTVKTPCGSLTIRSSLLGQHNVSNILAAIGGGISQNICLEDMKRGIEAVAGVPGRFERIEEGQDFTVAVDYAHTADALENLLQAARGITEKRIILIFGCGGDRDREKRPLMGSAAERLSDFSIITSDNPRSENPSSIIGEIERGFREAGGKKDSYLMIENREEAIRKGIEMARKGDTVLIAGKGHETYQIVGSEIRDFDDKKVVKKFLRHKKNG